MKIYVNNRMFLKPIEYFVYMLSNTLNKMISLKKSFHIKNEKGAVLVTGLLVVLLLTILATGAMMNITTELKISANDRSAKQVFYLAEAGVEDARSRMQVGASSSPINDFQPTNANLIVFIGEDTKAQLKGYQSTNSNHVLYAQLDPLLGYVVTIKHKLDASGNILKWGDSNGDEIPEENIATGKNIYVITSEGYDSTGGSKTVKVEASPFPSINIKAALYTKYDTTIQGTSTYVSGRDHCNEADVIGISTMGVVWQNGNPTIEGYPEDVIEDPSDTNDIQIDKLIKLFSSLKNGSHYYLYEVEGATVTGMSWGTPVPGATQQDASSCSERNIVYYDTNSTYVKLSGGTSGCGMLLVDGDLSVQGGFQWYGVILVTGSIAFTGGGGKNVTGAILSGGSVSADLVGGDANIVYCSRAISDQTDYLPLIVHRWVELFL